MADLIKAITEADKELQRGEVMTHKGLWNKYIISKTSGKPLDPNFYAIVLRIDGGHYLKACRAGVQSFADAVREDNPTLANDLDRLLVDLAAADIVSKIPKNTPKGSFLNP